MDRQEDGRMGGWVGETEESLWVSQTVLLNHSENVKESVGFC